MNASLCLGYHDAAIQCLLLPDLKTAKRRKDFLFQAIISSGTQYDRGPTTTRTAVNKMPTCNSSELPQRFLVHCVKTLWDGETQKRYVKLHNLRLTAHGILI